jgi:excisionase family DNA binding protein
MSNLLTVTEAAQLLGVSTKTIRRWENEGKIKAIRTEGGHRRFEDSTYEEDLAADVIEIITVFSARLYGSSSHKNKQIVKQLKQVAEELK